MKAYEAEYCCNGTRTEGYLVKFMGCVSGLIEYGENMIEFSKSQLLTYSLEHLISTTKDGVMCIKIGEREVIVNKTTTKTEYFREVRDSEKRKKMSFAEGIVNVGKLEKPYIERNLTDKPENLRSIYLNESFPMLYTYPSMFGDDYEKNILTKKEADAIYARYPIADDDERKAACTKLATSYIAYATLIHRLTPRIPEISRAISFYLFDMSAAWDYVKSNIEKKLDRLNKSLFKDNKGDFPNLTEAIKYFNIQGELNQMSLQMKMGNEFFLKEIIETKEADSVLGEKSYSFLFYNKMKTVDIDNIELFADGTSHYVPIKGAQLFVVSGKRPNETSFPILYLISKRKTEITYRALFSRLSKMVSQKKLLLHCDFELAIMQGAEEYFKVVPCYFHANQAFFATKIRMQRINGLMENILASKIALDNVYSEIAEAFEGREENRMTIRREFLNLLKLLMFVQPNIRDHLIQNIRARNLNGLERAQLTSSIGFMEKYSRFFPLDPSISLTNNVSEVYFSNFKSNFERKPTLFVFIRMMLICDRLKSDGRISISSIVTSEFERTTTQAFDARTKDSIELVIEKVWQWKKPIDYNYEDDTDIDEAEYHERVEQNRAHEKKKEKVDARKIDIDKTFNRVNTQFKKIKDK